MSDDRWRWGREMATARLWSWYWPYMAMGGPDDSLGRAIYSGTYPDLERRG